MYESVIKLLLFYIGIKLKFDFVIEENVIVYFVVYNWCCVLRVMEDFGFYVDVLVWGVEVVCGVVIEL